MDKTNVEFSEVFCKGLHSLKRLFKSGSSKVLGFGVSVKKVFLLFPFKKACLLFRDQKRNESFLDFRAIICVKLSGYFWPYVKPVSSLVSALEIWKTATMSFSAHLGSNTFLTWHKENKSALDLRLGEQLCHYCLINFIDTHTLLMSCCLSLSGGCMVWNINRKKDAYVNLYK